MRTHGLILILFLILNRIPPNSTNQPQWMSDLKDASSGRTSPVDLGPHPKPKAKRNKFAILCAILASMSSILLGYGEKNTPIWKINSSMFHSFR